MIGAGGSGRRTEDAAGFSLLELLVALTLLGLVATLAAGGVHFGRTAWEKGAARGEAALEIRVARKFLRRVIEGARDIRLRDGSRQPPLLFEGAPDRLRLASVLPTHLGPQGEQWVGLEVGALDGAEGAGLLLRFAPIGAARPSLAAGARVERLLDGVAALRFRYWGADAETGALGWRERWTARAAAPGLVEVTVRFREGDARRWPPLVARFGTAPL